jgi:6-phosphogluconolactonase/glucosamine-6-phosphate isomerase/deaminase
MQFIEGTDSSKGIIKLAEQLTLALSGNKRVLWLVCGGSNIPASVEVMNLIPRELTKNLAISLTDERYGEVGHNDSNWRQLDLAGFDGGEATLLPVLVPDLSLEETVARYALMAQTALNSADVTFAQFGIGPDGHIAGILPNTVAAAEQKVLAIGYTSDPFVRITLTFPALRQIDIAYAFAYGEAKHDALSKLHNKDLELREEPSQILKQLPEAYVYNDQIGGNT